MRKNYSVLFVLFFCASLNIFAQDEFITTWKTDNSGTSNLTSITIPTTGGGYNYDVDWNNDGIFDEIGITGSVTHDFGMAGTYTIKIRGDFPRIRFSSNSINAKKILSIEQWGAISWISMNRAFSGCSNLVINATDIPNFSGTEDTNAMFFDASSIGNGTGSWNWDMGTITSMASMFEGAVSFNKDISTWNVSQVTDMEDMFNGATSFNQNLSTWNVANVVYMGGMFEQVISFDQNLSTWDISSLEYGDHMFKGVTLSTENYDALLTGWSTDSSGISNDGIDDIPTNIDFSGGISKYCSSETARNTLINTYNWGITDGGILCDQPTWNGSTDSSWFEATNWSGNVAPLSTEDVLIPNVATTPNVSNTVEVNKLEIALSSAFNISSTGSVVVNSDFDTNETLTIESSATNSGTLLVKGTSKGIVSYLRGGLLANKWSIVSSPVIGQSIKEFAENPLNNIRINTSVSPNRYAISYYDDSQPSGNKWVYYTSDDLATNTLQFEKGRSYAISRATDGPVIFEGTLEVGDVNTPVNSAGWNSIGNPYTTFLPINKNGGSNFINENSSNMNPSNVGVYVWDKSQDKYVGKSLVSDKASLSPGQGFLIKTGGSTTNVVFNQSHRKSSVVTGGVFARGSSIEQPSIELLASSKGLTISTAIKYFENTTTGLDIGYDLGNYGRSGFDIFTRLVSNETKEDYTIQSLPTKDISTTIIPVGLKANAKDEIIFTAKTTGDVSVYLEDRKENIFRELESAENKTYTITTTENINGIGRFYLHTSINNKENLPIIEEVRIYNSDSETLKVLGIYKGDFKVDLYAIHGKHVFSTKSKGSGENTIELPSLERGVYIVKVVSELGVDTKKIIIK